MATASDLLSQLKDRLAPEDPPGSPPEMSWWPWLACTVLLAVVAVAVWRLRRRRTEPAPLSALDTALAELARIEAQQLIEAGEIGQFHVLAAEAVRGFLERQYELPATRRTTPEFLDALRDDPRLTEEIRSALAEFLRRCDLAKFAGVCPDAEACRSTLDLARRIIQLAAPPTRPRD
jgi:hypothetical protein